MKKNRMMRLASGLLVAVLATTSMISGTYAKYTTQDGAKDSARVAKWGVELQVVGNLYGESYGAGNLIVKDELNAAGVTVQSQGMTEDVVAPGTKNVEGFTFSLKGQPEVDGKVTTNIVAQNIFLAEGTYGVMIPVDTTTTVVTAANFDELSEAGLYYSDDAINYTKATTWENGKTYYTLEDVVVNNEAYYPVVYKLTGDTNYTTTSFYNEDTLVASADAIATSLGMTGGNKTTNKCLTTYADVVKTFDSNDNITENWNVDKLNLTWEWQYDWDACDEEGDLAGNKCKADTILGNMIAADSANVKVVKLDAGQSTATKVTINTVEPTATDMFATYKYVTVGEDVVACLTTQFAIDVVATQVD